MPATTITLDERHFKAAAAKARALGQTPERYIESLIDAATLTFDQILAPVREGYRASDGDEDALDTAVAKARKAVGRKSSRKLRK
jgi:hypothetical protein